MVLGVEYLLFSEEALHICRMLEVFCRTARDELLRNLIHLNTFPDNVIDFPQHLGVVFQKRPLKTFNELLLVRFMLGFERAITEAYVHFSYAGFVRAIWSMVLYVAHISSVSLV